MTMKWIAAMLSALLLLTACGTGAQSAGQPVNSSQSQKEAEAPDTSVTFTDDLGRTVTVDRPERVAAAVGSFAEVWLLAGGELCAVTEDAYSERKLELPKVESLGAMKSPSVEIIIAQGVDLLLLSAKTSEHVALQPTLEAAGVPFAYFEVETFEDYLRMLKICTEITGQPQKYVENGESVQTQIDAAIALSQGKESPRVLLIRAFSTGAKAKGSDNMTGVMLKDLGCTNIADSNTGLLEDLSMEKIIAEDPDFIFVTTMGASHQKALAALEESLTGSPAWAGLTAVQNGRFVVLDRDLFHYKPNVRWGESYETLANILYGN
ncbi:MAG: ABC transporter substrate-binding protein [Angelakisella sp.]|nr:ABC transporter substrate-binding protein [Angelakisella sp.]